MSFSPASRAQVLLSHREAPEEQERENLDSRNSREAPFWKFIRRGDDRNVMSGCMYAFACKYVSLCLCFFVDLGVCVARLDICRSVSSQLASPAVAFLRCCLHPFAAAALRKPYSLALLLETGNRLEALRPAPRISEETEHFVTEPRDSVGGGLTADESERKGNAFEKKKQRRRRDNRLSYLVVG
ncbi:hypothetical protein TGDOM2_262870 [Toxoplasma gondii GAB2-2007-GAL-DOM2]|uniref:Uncharacterized protein n=3 Tax=Toxoplasma gondii TaxID=5811 RepID=V4YUR4_TOXGV|nr:hypothetical protein TGVEG_262870 [Toxoplasma gondii VEG]KFG35132.1 hypothetical protein TGP89_262870 [Toxoplasma gondii p89]KFG49621.1 hypothetical protein TGDOM2_262870 [Toxoplasma gondii GAB2-2007-GAL-DOM2]CEL74166.1 TPA: hypothetical protein BN1205_071855 [Toxoplasma gondii VEG]